MAKLERKLTKIFANNSGSQGTTVYGSKASGTVQYSKDLDDLQSTEWEIGREAGVIANSAPVLEDDNTVDFVMSRQIKYIQQMGICEWLATETYYINSFCAYNGVIYKSLTNNNINHNPANDNGTNWEVSNTDSNKLFDYKISDRYLWAENPKWLPYAIFASTQVNGASKLNIAPQTLLDLYNNGTAFSETIAGITIAGIQAQNGMKIVRLRRRMNSYYCVNTGNMTFADDENYYSYWIIKGVASGGNWLKLLAQASNNTPFSANNLQSFTLRNFIFNTKTDITTAQAILGRDIYTDSIASGFCFYIENGSLKVDIYTTAEGNTNHTPTHTLTMFNILATKTYNFVSFNITYNNNNTYTITATIRNQIDNTPVETYSTTINQAPFGFSQCFFVGIDQYNQASATADKFWQAVEFNLTSFSISITDSTTVKEYKDFYIPYWTNEVETVYSRTGCASYWGVFQDTDDQNYITLIPPRNNALIGNQQVDYSSQGLMLNYTARNFNGYSYTATDDCVAFFNSKVMYSYCYAFVNGVQVFNSGMNGTAETAGSNSITIPLKKGDVLTFQQESSGGGGSKDSVLYVYRKKYVIDTNRNEQVYYYLY